MITTDDGTGIHFTDTAGSHRAGAPVTVLIGGYGMAATGWALQTRALSEVGHRVIEIDRRCHGLSDCPPQGQSLDRHALDIEAVLGHLGLEAVHLVGSSMGASSIWAYLRTVGTRRVRSVVSVDQTPKMINDDAWPLGLYGLYADGVDDFVKGFPGTVPVGDMFHSPPPEEAVALLASESKFSFDATRDLLRDHTERDWRPVIAAVDVPVLAIGARHSPLWPPDSSAWIADAAPHGTYAEMETGHVPFIEKPDEFNRLLSDFLAGC